MAGKLEDIWQPYSEEQVNKIVAEVSITVGAAKRTYLHHELNEAARKYLFLRGDPTPARLRNHLTAIENAAERLASALRTGKYKSQSTTAEIFRRVPVRVLSRLVDSAESDSTKNVQSTIDSGFDRVKEAILSVSSLQRWASSAATEVNKEVKPRGKTPDIDRIFFARDLARIYHETFGRVPGVSRHPSTHVPRGPFIRFVDSCLIVIGENRRLESVAELAKTGQEWALKTSGQLETKKDN